MLDRQTLLTLSQYRNRERPVISLYVTLDRTAADDRALLTMKNLLAEGESARATLDGAASQGVAADLATLREAVRAANGGGAAGLALFACGEALEERIELPFEVPNEITLSDRPRLRPLLRLLQRYERYLAILSDARDARLFIVTPEGTEALAVIADETPGRHDQGGWAQARIQRHQDRRVEEHLARAAERAFELHQQRPFDGVVLLGTDDRMAALEEQLHPYLRERLLGSEPMDMEASGQAVTEAVMAIARDQRWVRQGATVEEWSDDLLSRSGLAVAGLAGTLRAAQQGQIMKLLMEADLSASGGKCAQCGAFADQGEGECEYCGGALRPLDDIVEALTVSALAQGAEIFFLDPEGTGAPLMEHGGVGAILRYAAT